MKSSLETDNYKVATIIWMVLVSIFILIIIITATNETNSIKTEKKWLSLKYSDIRSIRLEPVLSIYGRSERTIDKCIYLNENDIKKIFNEMRYSSTPLNLIRGHWFFLKQLRMVCNTNSNTYIFYITIDNSEIAAGYCLRDEKLDDYMYHPCSNNGSGGSRILCDLLNEIVKINGSKWVIANRDYWKASDLGSAGGTGTWDLGSPVKRQSQEKKRPHVQ